MGSYKNKGIIKKLDGFIKPNITRNEKGNVLNVGMTDGQKYFNYNKLESGIEPKPRYFDESMHKSWGGFNYYLYDMACLIDNGQIYIEYVKPPVEEKVEIPDNQISMF